MKFVVKNVDLFPTNTFTHDFDTRHKTLLHTPVAKLSSFQREFIIQECKSLTDCHQKLSIAEVLNLVLKHYCGNT
jgi:hypothetical protein